LDDPKIVKWKEFQNGEAHFSLKAERGLSLLFPVPLDADKYKTKSSNRLVGQTGYSYCDFEFVRTIIEDEFRALCDNSILEDEVVKLHALLEYITGSSYDLKKLVNESVTEEELINYYVKDKSEIIQDLKNIDEFNDEEVVINGRTFKRDVKTIAQLKILRGFKCQICSTSILKADGHFYIEAAHIKPKRFRGREIPENILILCPNHHKEFDHGETKILKHTKDFVEFVMNGMQYKISLIIDQVDELHEITTD